MVGPLINTPINPPTDRVQPTQEETLCSHIRSSGGSDPAWFLPQRASSLQPISASIDPTLQGASPILWNNNEHVVESGQKKITAQLRTLWI